MDSNLKKQNMGLGILLICAGIAAIIEQFTDVSAWYQVAVFFVGGIVSLTFFLGDRSNWLLLIPTYIMLIIAVLGAIVGLVSAYGMGTITEKEVPSFLLAGIALVVMYGVFKGIELDPWIGSLLHGVSMSLSILIAPAVGILAIKAIWDIGKEI